MRPSRQPPGRGRNTSRSLAGTLLLLLGAGLTAHAEAALPPGVGVLLPIQDRVGGPELARLVETELERELAARSTLAPTADVRPVLRALRIRDASDEPPDRLATLAEHLEVDWFFLVTLHEVHAGGRPRREDGALRRALVDEGSGETPQIALSARILEKGSDELWWAGFRAASGRDWEGILGLGEIEYLEDLTRRVVSELVAAAADPAPPRTRRRLRHPRIGYARAPGGPAPPARVAVLPMDSVAEVEAGAAAEVVTAALFAALAESGFKPVLPGLVRTIRQDSGRTSPGAAASAEWEALAREAEWITTGTVETYRRGYGRDPIPWVAFSIRFVRTADGRIDAFDGLERTGPETASVFDRGRIYSSAELAHELMRSLMYGLQPAPRSARTELSN